jgi:hypothetical protein
MDAVPSLTADRMPIAICKSVSGPSGSITCSFMGIGIAGLKRFVQI